MKLTSELKVFNSFGIEANAMSIHIVKNKHSLQKQWLNAKNKQLPVLLLGSGSNILFTENFEGVVIINRIKGIKLTETNKFWHIHAHSGENWHQLIITLLNKGIYGIENLAMIPGCVGSAPIQNIGAYGLEFKDICEYVDILSLKTNKVSRLSANKCKFKYRDSIFKHEYQNTHIIIHVGLILSKTWSPKLKYDIFKKFNPFTVTPQQIFKTVCQARKNKLPDPAIFGNAGSFFKNPIISKKQAKKIKEDFPNCPQYIQSNGKVKLAAGWLIDQCGLKGYELGGAAVHTKQALVLINKNSASQSNIINLAKFLTHTIANRFNIILEPEVRFIGKKGEINAMNCIL
ncbi:UDP-N-acetylenolpyruvoylglucosamine reductase [Candidatus Providencia siddallii]|uniref:UDP-N-acetylenolpyruvoylglucosamine reductase n=1 Tax=Candidatus Providencia siddallii TaxID=1715285 RepID=A0A0M6W8W5_9GAMM|nr:UDP-N-acetylenolpyruvoylglucosamine reductase [Candidatus Providencia siddallii]